MTTRHRRRRIARTTVVGAAVVALVSLTGCTSGSDDKPAVVTLPENNTTTVPPSTLAPGGSSGQASGPSDPPQVAWVAQIGGAGDDRFSAATGAGADVVATGTTSAGVNEPTAGGTDVLTARVDSDGQVRRISQFGSPLNDAALAITGLEPVGKKGATVIPDNPDGLGSGGDGESDSRSDGSPNDGDRVEATPFACGTTLALMGAGAFGGRDAWCGPAESHSVSTTPSDRGSQPRFEAIPGILQFGGDRNDSITGVTAAGSPARSSTAASGYIYMSGSTDGFYPGAEDPAGQGLGAGDALAFRTTATGEMSWIRQFGTQGADAALGVCAVGSDGFYVGWTEGSLSGPSKGGRDAWISFIDASGIQRWISQFGSAGNDEFRAVANAGEASRGTMQLIAVGSTTGDIDSEGPAMNAGGSDAVVASFAPDGSMLWSKQFGSGLDDEASAVAVDGSTIYVTGTTTSEAPASPDSSGRDTPGGTGSEAAPEGSTTTTKPPVQGIGDVDTSVGKGGARDAFLAALDADSGEILWVIRLGSEKDETATGVAITGNGLLVIAGSTNGKLGESSPAGGYDGFLIAFPLPAAGGAAASSV